MLKYIKSELKELSKLSNHKNFTDIVVDRNEKDDVNKKEKFEFAFYIYTSTNRYYIAVSSNGTKEMLGCQVSTRKQKPGHIEFETSNLFFDKLTKKNWRAVKDIIFMNEMLGVAES